MQVEFTDFNGADQAMAANHAADWETLLLQLETMPLHLKHSDQAGFQGSLIFDPVGTNEHLKQALVGKGWRSNLPIAQEFDFLGTDVDFIHNGLLVEVQFSNYPFLLNNTVRSELFFKSKAAFGGNPIDSVVIVTKAHMFPASNSTLYYEQAKNQLSALVKHGVFSVPIRLIRLFEIPNTTVPATFTAYHEARYSRTVVKRDVRQCIIKPGVKSTSRCTLRLA